MIFLLKDIVKIWELFYIGNTEKRDKFVPMLKECYIERSFDLKELIYKIIVPQNYRNILIAGCKKGIIKYIDL